VGERYWDDLRILPEEIEERESGENVGAPTFKVTLEGNYFQNTGTMSIA